jgi:hypothetical protein
MAITRSIQLLRSPRDLKYFGKQFAPSYPLRESTLAQASRAIPQPNPIDKSP